MSTVRVRRLHITTRPSTRSHPAARPATAKNVRVTKIVSGRWNFFLFHSFFRRVLIRNAPRRTVENAIVTVVVCGAPRAVGIVLETLRDGKSSRSCCCCCCFVSRRMRYVRGGVTRTARPLDPVETERPRRRYTEIDSLKFTRWFLGRARFWCFP